MEYSLYIIWGRLQILGGLGPHVTPLDPPVPGDPGGAHCQLSYFLLPHWGGRTLPRLHPRRSGVGLALFSLDGPALTQLL